ncbi:hypothetical protein D3C79_661860 [compost metagenome]
MERAAAIAKVAGQHQRQQAGTDGNGNRSSEHVWAIDLLGIGTHGSHAGVMHRGDTQADANSRLKEMPGAKIPQAQGIHRQPASEQHDRQRQAGQGEVVVHFNGCLKRQHADEMQRPDSASQAAGTEQSPLSLGCWVFHMVQAFGHAQGGVAACASYQKSQYYQVRVVMALKDDLSGCRKFGEQM